MGEPPGWPGRSRSTLEGFQRVVTRTKGTEAVSPAHAAADPRSGHHGGWVASGRNPEHSKSILLILPSRIVQ